MERPVEMGRKEDPQVTNGLGDGDPVGRVRPGGKKDGGRGNAKEAGGDTRGVKEHKFSFVEVDGEAGKGKPGPDPVPGGGDFGDGRKEGGTGGKDVPVVNVKGEVDIVPIVGGAEEGGGGKSGEDRGEGRTLRRSLVDGKRVRGVAVKGQAYGAVSHEAPHPVAGEGVDAEAGEGVNGEGRVKVVKEAGDVKEKDRAHAARSDRLFRFVTEGCGGVRGGMVSARAELPVT